MEHYLSSERQLILHATERMGGVELGSEMVQVATNEEDGAWQWWKAAFAWVKNPITLLLQHLDSLHKRQLLSWHKRGQDGPSLPSHEIGVKIWWQFQYGNANSKPTEAEFSRPYDCLACLEADDTIANLHVFLDYFRQVIHDMQELH